LEREARLGCLVVAVPLLILLSPLIALWIVWDRYREGALRRRFVRKHGPQSRGILVYSNSPNWQRYIETNWLPRIGNRLVILNWSERVNWSKRFPVEFALARSLGDRDFNPAAIVLLPSSTASVFATWLQAIRHFDLVGMLAPYSPSKEVVRFFQPFRDFKHGKDHTLRAAEARLWRLLGLDGEEHLSADDDLLVHAKGRRRRKGEYKVLFETTSAIMLKHNPIGLDFETNIDEYDPEARTVIPRLRDCASSGDVERVLHEEFCAWFTPELAGPAEAYRAMAEELWRFWSSSPIQRQRTAGEDDR
jgi:hypothetical protein